MSIKVAALVSVRWTAASALSRAALQIAQVTLLARLLSPADFGLMAMAGVALAMVSLFADLGVSSALMHHDLPDRRTLSSLYWLNITVACMLGLLFFAMGWPLANAYGEPELVAVIGLLSLSFPLAALGQQFRVISEKELRFKILSQNEVAAAVTGFSVAIGGAFATMGVYALIFGQLASAAMNSALAWLRLSNGVRPTFSFCWSLTRPFTTFGLHRIGDSFWNAALTQWDIFVAGLYASPHALAMYTMPREQSLRIANTIVNPVITRVSLPLMTQLRSDPAVLQGVYLKVLRLTASFNFPIYAMLALFSEGLVVLLLGSQWTESAWFLRVFALWGLVRSTGNPSGSVLYAVGMAKRAHVWNLSLFICSAPIFWFAVRSGGLEALACVLLTWMCVIYVLAWYCLIRPACGASFRAYFSSIAPPLLTTALSSLTVWAVTVPITTPTFSQLAIGALVFSTTYLASSWLFNRTPLKMLAELLHPLSKRAP